MQIKFIYQQQKMIHVQLIEIYEIQILLPWEWKVRWY